MRKTVLPPTNVEGDLDNLQVSMQVGNRTRVSCLTVKLLTASPNLALLLISGSLPPSHNSFTYFELLQFGPLIPHDGWFACSFCGQFVKGTVCTLIQYYGLWFWRSSSVIYGLTTMGCKLLPRVILHLIPNRPGGGGRRVCCLKLVVKSMKLVIPSRFISWKNSLSVISRRFILANIVMD